MGKFHLVSIVFILSCLLLISNFNYAFAKDPSLLALQTADANNVGCNLIPYAGPRNTCTTHNARIHVQNSCGLVNQRTPRCTTTRSKAGNTNLKLRHERCRKARMNVNKAFKVARTKVGALINKSGKPVGYGDSARSINRKINGQTRTHAHEETQADTKKKECIRIIRGQ